MPSTTESFRQRASTCVLLTIAVICICILTLCGVMIVREYTLAKGYEPTTCRVTNVTYANPVRCRFCTATDKTQKKGSTECTTPDVPCVRISVTYNLGRSPRTALLHPDSVQAAGKLAKCSFEICLRTDEENKAAVQAYAQPWQRKNTTKEAFECFYKMDDPETVIVQKRHSRSTVIHSMLWPSLVIVVCGVIFLRLEMQRRRLTFCGKKPPADDVVVRKDKRNGNDVKQTLLQAHSNNDLTTKVDCRLMQTPEAISTSMPALDRLKPVNEYGGTAKVIYGYGDGNIKMIVPSISVDGLHHVDAGDVTNASPIHLDKFGADRRTEGGSSQGSQSSKIMGLETPV